MSLKVTADNEKNPQLWKVLVAAKYANVEVETTIGTSKLGLGKTPVLETKDGAIFDANSIARYIARLSKDKLYGSNEFEASVVDQYIDFANNDIELPGSAWIYPILGKIANNQAVTAKAQGDIKKALAYLNNQLNTKTFLVGERITIADIVVAMSLYHLFQKVLDVNFRKSCPNVTRWYTTVVNQPHVKSVVGDVVLAEKAEVAPATFTPKEEAPKKKEEKKPEPKKEAPKKKEKKPEPEDDEDDTMEDEGPKTTNPLDLLPKSSMVFDEWKRTYSNAKDTKGDAMPWLWKNFDKNGYCIFMCDYKYNDECEKAFMTCNLISGWFQRLEKLHKYAFGSMIIFGDEPKLEISGIWIFRGSDVPAEMKITDDFEHYNWKQLDSSDASTQQLIGDYFAWEGDFGGRKFNQGKIFK